MSSLGTAADAFDKFLLGIPVHFKSPSIEPSQSPHIPEFNSEGSDHAVTTTCITQSAKVELPPLDGVDLRSFITESLLPASHFTNSAADNEPAFCTPSFYEYIYPQSYEHALYPPYLYGLPECCGREHNSPFLLCCNQESVVPDSSAFAAESTEDPGKDSSAKKPPNKSSSRSSNKKTWRSHQSPGKRKNAPNKQIKKNHSNKNKKMPPNLECQDEVFLQFVPLDLEKYKTELCRQFQVHGFCKYEERCNYAHGYNQLRTSYRHGKYKTRNCLSYHTSGCCRYGSRCSFIHDPEEGVIKCSISNKEVPGRGFGKPGVIGPLLPLSHLSPSLIFPLVSETTHEDRPATITWRLPTEEGSPAPELHLVTGSQEFPSTLKKGYLSQSLTSLSECRVPTRPRYTSLSINYGESSTIGELDIVKDMVKDSKEYPEWSGGDGADLEYTEHMQRTPQNNQDVHSYEQICAGNEDSFSDIEEDILSDSEAVYPCYKYSAPSGPLERETLIAHALQNGVDDLLLSQTELSEFLRSLRIKETKHQLAPPSWPRPRTPRAKTSFPAALPHEQAKYKTELCRSYQYNEQCQYDESCLYAHGAEDLRSYPKHPMYRTKQCFTFHNKGFCLYGSRCQFLHNLS